MNGHPLNLAVRFLLEIAILVTLGAWGWQYGDGWQRWPAAIILPLGAAAIWGILRTIWYLMTGCGGCWVGKRIVRWEWNACSVNSVRLVLLCYLKI